MIERYLEVEKAAKILDFNGWEWVLSEEDVACLRAVAGVIKEIVDMLFLLEGEKYPTFSMIIPVLSFLKSGPFRPKPGDSAITKAVRRAIEDYVDDRYPISSLHRIATLLDPRFVQLQPFIPEYDKEQWLRQTTIDLKDIVDQIVPVHVADPLPSNAPDPSVCAEVVEQGSESTSSADVSTKSTEPTTKKQKINPFFAYMMGSQKGQSPPSDNNAQKATAPGTKETPKTKVAKELKNFLKVPQLDPKADPMKWWKDNQELYPTLAQIARRVLAIPASSAPTERVFSKMSRVNAKDRSSMKPALANALLMC